MRRLALLLFGGLMAAATGLSSTYYAIEVKGGSRLYAIDKPVQKGKVLLFHRYPDGTYMSLSAVEVGKVETLAEAPQPDRHAPGETLYIGGLLSGPSAPLTAPMPAEPPSDATYMDEGYGYGYSGWGWGGGGGNVPRPPGPVPPSRIGPNGFPILAPPGSPGSTQPPIGPNGFPVLSPQPQASPRSQALAPVGPGSDAASSRRVASPRRPQ